MEGKDFIENDVFVYREDDSLDEDDQHFANERESLKLFDLHEKEVQREKTTKKDFKIKKTQ